MGVDGDGDNVDSEVVDALEGKGCGWEKVALVGHRERKLDRGIDRVLGLGMDIGVDRGLGIGMDRGMDRQRYG